MNNPNKDKQNPAETPLFRNEVLQKTKGSYQGKIIITNPISFTCWSLGIFLVTIMLIIFLSSGEYTRRQEVQGMLVPDKGLINIYAKKSGIVTNKFIQQGDTIKAGQILYYISTDQHTLAGQTLSEQQVGLLKNQIHIQENRITILEKNVARYKHLLQKKLILETDYQKVYDTYLSAKSSLNELKYRMSEINSSSNYVIRAPENGTVSVLTTMIGDRATEQTLVASIIPQGAILQGVLYVPTNAIGFIRPGQKVLLKYQAYPFQQFGLYEATVEYIDKSILSSQDIKIPINLNIPFYRVLVALKKQTVTIHGQAYPLVAGMLFEGIVLSEKRTLWQWIMSPVYNLKGGLTS
ncbi:HlyD family secretion protein [Candidatus Jidaibacter acanthamoebae]|nr:HlyD family efflux transporter periplasmic adaptor subunit [Candidatus Jidaibacter acanthamoeba]